MTPPTLRRDPPLLHVGRVAHIRHTPIRHRFAYRFWMLSVDLDDLDDRLAPDGRVAGLRLLRHGRAGLFSIRNQDHGARDGSDLRGWVRAELAGAGLPAAGAQIRLMLVPRLAGYAFNPIAFFFCHDADGVLRAVVHQVKNTFGGQHAYVLPVPEAATPAALVRQSAQKRLYVSPFFDTAGLYRFAFTRPDFTDPAAAFSISIRYGTDAPRMTASMRLVARPCTDAGLLRLLVEHPLMPMKVIAAIHWQALRLWLRGAKFHPNPNPAIRPMRTHRKPS